MIPRYKRDYHRSIIKARKRRLGVSIERRPAKFGQRQGDDTAWFCPTTPRLTARVRPGDGNRYQGAPPTRRRRQWAGSRVLAVFMDGALKALFKAARSTGQAPALALRCDERG